MGTIKVTTKKDELIIYVRNVKRVIRIIATLLATFFTFLKFRGISFDPLFSEFSTQIILQIALAIYFFAWIFGTIFDLNLQENAFVNSPSKGKLTLSALGFMVYLGAVFGLLCWVDSLQKFTIILTVFFISGILGWLYIIKVVTKKLKEDSIRIYEEEENFVKLEQLELIKHFMEANWQRLRFTLGVIYLVILIIFNFTTIPVYLSKILKISSPESIIAYGILLFVIWTEAWIWFKRIQVNSSKQTIKMLDEKYDLWEKTNTPNTGS